MDIIRKYVKEAVNGYDLLDMVGGKANLIIYPDLINYDNIDQILGPYGACFILFEQKKRYGHWVLIFKRNKNTIEFFNSYGGYPDDSLKDIPYHYRKISNQIYPYLSCLLDKSPYKLEYNQYKFQKENYNTKTCGRWCAIRLIFRDININNFKKIFKNVDGDDLVTYLTI